MWNWFRSKSTIFQVCAVVAVAAAAVWLFVPAATYATAAAKLTAVAAKITTAEITITAAGLQTAVGCTAVGVAVVGGVGEAVKIKIDKAREEGIAKGLEAAKQEAAKLQKEQEEVTTANRNDLTQAQVNEAELTAIKQKLKQEEEGRENDRKQHSTALLAQQRVNKGMSDRLDAIETLIRQSPFYAKSTTLSSSSTLKPENNKNNNQDDDGSPQLKARRKV